MLSNKQKQRLKIVLLTIWESTKTFIRFLFTPEGKSPYSARFMTGVERAKLLSPYNTGVSITGGLRLDEESSMKHILVTGASGSGKSVNCFYNSIYSLDRPMVILDASTALFKNTSGFLASKGFKVYQLNFSEPSKGLPYNVLKRAKDFTALKKIASNIVMTSLGSSGGDKYWVTAASQMLFVVMAFVKESMDEKYHNLANIRYLFNHLSTDIQSETYQLIMMEASPEIYSEFKGVMVGNEKTVSSVLNTVKVSLEKIADPELARMTSFDTIGDLQKLRRNKTVLYLSVKESEIEYYSFLISLVLSDLFDTAMNELTDKDLPWYFILDEFSNFYVENFATNLLTFRKHKVSATICSQTKSRLYDRYKGEAEAIINGGVSNFVYMPGQVSQKDNEQLSRQMGSNLVKHKGQEILRPLLSPDDIFCMEDQCIFMQAGKRPDIINLRPFYKDPKLLAQSKMPPVTFDYQLPKTVELVDLSAFTKREESTSFDV